MTSEFANFLIKRGVLALGCVVGVKSKQYIFGQQSRDNVINYQVIAVSQGPEPKILIENDYQRYWILAETVMTIEDMTIERIAESYEVDLKGKPLPAKIDPITGEPVRRGRKTKEYHKLKKEIEKNATNTVNQHTS